MPKVYINPGHDYNYDSGAVNPNSRLRECVVALKIGNLVKQYLEAVGYECKLLQSDNLYYDSDHEDRPVAVCADADYWGADVFVSIHCNAFDGSARGTEVECYDKNGEGGNLAQCIQDQIVQSVGTVDRGVREMPKLIVLKHTDMPAVLVETAFIDNDDDAALLVDKEDDFARAIARGISDYFA